MIIPTRTVSAWTIPAEKISTTRISTKQVEHGLDRFPIERSGRQNTVSMPTFRVLGWIEICAALFVASLIWLLLFSPAQAQDIASTDPLPGNARIYVPMASADAVGQSNSANQSPSPVAPPSNPSPAPAVPQAECQLNSQEAAVAALMTEDSRQKRARMVCDPILSKVARERAESMAEHGYFGHVNPSGQGPNYLVTQAGYTLPDWYSKARDGNNIESIGAGYTSAASVWDAWLSSPGHRRHVLAEEDGARVSFYTEQEAYGIGYWADPDSPFKHYWVVLSAPIAD